MTPVWERHARDVPRSIWPGGRVRITLPDGNKRDLASYRAAMDRLRTWGAWDVLAAIRDGRLAVNNVIAAVKLHGEGALVDLRAQVVAHRAGEVPTLEEEADEYMAHYEGDDRSPQSTRQVRMRLRVFCRQERGDGTLGAVRLHQMTAQDIEAGLRSIGGGNAWRESVRSAVSGLFRWSLAREAERARVQQDIPRWTVNPVKAVERREVKPRVVTLAPRQVSDLLAASEVYQAAYLRTLLGLGFRFGELVHTRMHDDLDLRDWTWRIQGRGPDARCGCVACAGRGWRPKSKHSTRTLHVPALDSEGKPLAVRTAILRYLEHYPAEPGDFVFRNPRTNGVWQGDALADDFRRLCERAGVVYGANKPRGVTVHATRHTCATELIRAGVGVPEVAALLGDTVEVVVATYVHLTADDISRAIARAPNY